MASGNEESPLQWRSMNVVFGRDLGRPLRMATVEKAIIHPFHRKDILMVLTFGLRPCQGQALLSGLLRKGLESCQ